MKKIGVSPMLEKKYKTRMLVGVACHVSYERADKLLHFLRRVFPRRSYEFYLCHVISGMPKRYSLYYSLNCRELEEVISRYKKENEE